MRNHRVIRSLCLGVVASLTALALLSCSSSTPAPSPTSDSSNVEGVVYRTVDGTDLKLDACPAAPQTSSPAAGTPAVILIHGGGFQEGGRSSSGMPQLCSRLAAAGYSAFSIDYRLLPADPYPAQVDDATAAVAWLREPAQVAKYGIDPARIALLGSSAGAIIALSVATAGTGPLDSGTRVKAVVSLSGAVDLTERGLTLGTPADDVKTLIYAYLNCTDLASCPSAKPASPLYAVSSDDPPTMLLNSDNELVPVEQAEAMKAALTGASVPNQLVIEPGSKHGTALVTSTNARKILAFLQEYL